MKNKGDFTKLLTDMQGFAEQLAELNQQALRQYTPLVQKIINSGTKDEKFIERTLDGLLDFAGNEKILLLYKKLCRYYYYINPVATVRHIKLYKEMWEKSNMEK